MKHLAQSGAPDAIDNLLSALEVVNKEAMIDGVGGGIHGPASDILSGIKQLRSTVAKGNDNFLHSDQTEKVLSKNRQMGTLKAELVRN